MRLLNWKKQISQKKLEQYLRASEMLKLTEQRMLEELEEGASVEPGEHTVIIREIRTGAVIVRSLRVE